MPAAAAYRIQIVQPDAGLADGQGIGRRRNQAGGHEGLEVGDRCDCEINIVTPTGNHWISGNSSVALGLEVAQIVLSHLVQGVFALEYRRADESVRVAGRVSTGPPDLIPCPEELAAA